MGIIKKLEHLATGNAYPLPHAASPGRKIVLLGPASFEVYKTVIRRLPCSACVKALVDLFFAEVNWQYAIVDQNDFDDHLEEYYRQTDDPVPDPQPSLYTDRVIFPALLFQILALAVQFMPAEAPQGLHDSCLARLTGGDARADCPHHDSTKQLLDLLDKDMIDLTYVQAELLRVDWLKNSGLIAEAWHALAQTILDAQEMGLHRDDGKIHASDAETACEQLWQMVLRRRLMLNLFLWDR